MADAPAIKVRALVPMDLEITPRDLAAALIGHVGAQLGIEDDAGCDWYTTPRDRIGFGGGFLASNVHLAALVDAANVLRYGDFLTVPDPADDAESQP